MHLQGSVVGHDHQPVPIAVGQGVPELRVDADAPFRVDRVPEMAPKHALPWKGGSAPPSAVGHPYHSVGLHPTSWPVILSEHAKTCQGKTGGFLEENSSTGRGRATDDPCR